MAELSGDEKNRILKNKQKEEIRNKLIRESQERTQSSIAKQNEGIESSRNTYYGYAEEYNKILAERHRTLGTESAAALILQMAISLKAYAKLSSSFKELILREACLAVSENFNYNNNVHVSSFLVGAAETARSARIHLDENLNTEGHFNQPLPPMLIPFLAEVDDTGQLKMSLNLINDQMTEADRLIFVQNFQTPFIDSMKAWILDAKLEDGTARFDIRANPTPDSPPIVVERATDAPVTPEDFKTFRNETLAPELTRYFGVEFVPEPSEPVRSMGPK